LHTTRQANCISRAYRVAARFRPTLGSMLAGSPNDPYERSETGRSETYAITFAVRPAECRRLLDLLDGLLDAMRLETTFIRAAVHIDPDDENRFQLHET
jgi:hypothetical protein